MSEDSFPITPPPELVQQWFLSARAMPVDQWVTDVATQAARWGYQQGADTELNECCKWLPNLPPWSADDLRKHRRPKPPSLKEQALAVLDNNKTRFAVADEDTIRRALEALPND